MARKRTNMNSTYGYPVISAAHSPPLTPAGVMVPVPTAMQQSAQDVRFGMSDFTTPMQTVTNKPARLAVLNSTVGAGAPSGPAAPRRRMTSSRAGGSAGGGKVLRLLRRGRGAGGYQAPPAPKKPIGGAGKQVK